MFEVYRKEITWGGKLLTFETGKIARQADGAVMVTMEAQQFMYSSWGFICQTRHRFFPLTVNYQEKNFCCRQNSWRIFQKRGTSFRKGNFVSRLIDRPIRPLFHKNYKNETQIIATVLAMTWKMIQTLLQ